MSMPLTKKELDNYWNILQSNLTNLKLDIDFPYKTIYEEIEPFLDNFVVHREVISFVDHNLFVR